MEEKRIEGGARISPPDPRDYHIAGAIPVGMTFPEEFMVPEKVTEVYHQGNTMMCVAYSLALIKELQELRERKQRIVFSKSFIYSNRSAGDFFEEGMYPREALKHLQDEGVCESRLMDEHLTAWWLGLNKVTPEIKANALKYRIKSYARVYTDTEVKSALMTLGAVTASIPWTYGPKGFKGGYNEMIDEAYVQEYGFGNHMITILGWKKFNGKNYWVCVNSYGSSWGEFGGFFYLPFGYMFNEIWAITDAIEEKKLQYYRVQLGAFSIKKNAEDLAAKLKAQNFPTYLVQINGLWKVQSGAFSTQANAAAYQKKLTEKGFKSFITYY